MSGKLLGKPKESGADSKKSEDVSGIACTTTSGFPRICLVADDETQGAQIVILEDGKLIAGDFVRLIEDSFADKPLELDAEGVAFADGSFYVIGSHGRPRHEEGADAAAKIEARARASSRIFCIRFAPDSIDIKTGKLNNQPEIMPSLKLIGLLRAQKALEPFVDKPLEENGLTVEGVAVRDGVLYAGLRGPVPDDHRAAILSVPLPALFDGRSGKTTLLRPMLGVDHEGKARGVRDLVTFEGRLLVLAGPVNDPAKGHPIELGDYTVFSYGEDTEKLLDLEGYGSETKPEALLPLGESDGILRALLLFDGPEEGLPTPIEIKLK
ncbi:DUF3616 domain-containing protein [Mesorhizobium sp. M0142]|uniref:DUF3616 domain-containing protein n=1 Tax=unclassified Mesorhizobium TaxID=325217 RepID=UPI00333A53B0